MQRHTTGSSTSPKEPMLSSLLSPCTGYQLQLASSSRHWCLHIEQPQLSTHLLSLTITNLHPLRSLRSASEHCLVVPSQRGSKSLSRTFSFTVPGRWNDLHIPSGMLDPCQFSSNNWKLISFNSTWLHKKKKKKKSFHFFKIFIFLLSFSPSLASLYFIWTMPET